MLLEWEIRHCLVSFLFLKEASGRASTGIHAVERKENEKSCPTTGLEG